MNVLSLMKSLFTPASSQTPASCAARDREILLYCASGGRSGLAARLLAQEGFQAHNTGGLTNWAAADWPVVPPQGN